MIAALLPFLLSAQVSPPTILQLDCQMYWDDVDALDPADGRPDLKRPAPDHQFTIELSGGNVNLKAVDPLINHYDGAWTGKVSKGRITFKADENRDGDEKRGKLVFVSLNENGRYAVAWRHRVIFGQHIGFVSYARGRCTSAAQTQIETIQ